jgi:hypothetical protein
VFGLQAIKHLRLVQGLLGLKLSGIGYESFVNKGLILSMALTVARVLQVTHVCRVSGHQKNEWQRDSVPKSRTFPRFKQIAGEILSIDSICSPSLTRLSCG